MQGRSIVHGSLAGAIATTTMTAFMRGSQYSGWYRRELPPTSVTRSVVRTLGMRHQVSSEEEIALMGLFHWGFGIVSGALFGAALGGRRQQSSIIGGLVFGLLIWAISYMGWVPALGILPQPWNQRGKHGLMPFAAHVVFGATLGIVFGRLERR